MEHQRWIKRSLISAAVAASVGLTACGGGGGADGTIDTTTTLSGVVADGYLVNATVCLDINLSKTCDSGEPTATSTSGGSYSLDATQAQIDTSPIVAEIIAGTTVDEDNPIAPVTKAYTLSAPAGKGAFVSPLSTMVQAQIETTGKTAEQIENEILASIGQDPTVVSLFDDYVAQKTDTTNSPAVQNSYLQLHRIAQITAATIANNIETIKAAIDNNDISMDLSTTLDSVITIIVQNVIAELTAIASEIDSSTAFDANTIATTVVPPLDTTTIEDQVAVAEAPSVDTSNVEAIFTAGISWLWAEFSDWEGNELERSSITYDAITGKLAEPIESYFETVTPGWSVSPNTNDNFVLQADGTWLAVADNWDGASVTFNNTTGTATVNSNRGLEALSNIKASDLTGLSVKAFVANKLPELSTFIDPASVFSAGSSAYSLNFTTLEETYLIWIGGCLGGGNGDCNVVYDNSSGTPVAVTSLADLPSQAAWVDDGSSWPRSYTISIYANLYFELVQDTTNTSGPVNYYHNPTGTSTLSKVGTGTWSITTVNGVEMLMVDHPDALMSQFLPLATNIDSPEENHFFAIQDFVVRMGKHFPANIVESTAESILTNQQAQDEITGAFLSSTVINTTPSAELACDTNSDWNLLIDEPLITYSFADFESVVATCGEIVAIPATGLGDDGNGNSRTYSLSDTATITFNPDNTGFYTRSGQSASSFNWSVDLATGYIILVSPNGSFRDILAVIDVDTTTPNITFKGYSYIEEVGRSDMVTSSGSDGQIVPLSSYSSYSSY